MKQKKYFILIEPDSNEVNASREQFRYYQKDGETVAVAIGVRQEVPEWVAKRAKEIGEIRDYFEMEA